MNIDPAEVDLARPAQTVENRHAQRPDVVDVSILIVNYNTAHLLPRLKEALQSSDDPPSYELIIVDNASRDDSLSVLRREFPTATLIANRENVGFGRANNQGLARCRGRYVLLLNTDAFVAPDTLRKTVSYMEAHPRCGILGVRLVGSDGEPQPGCRSFATPLNVFVNRAGLRPLFPRLRMVDEPGGGPAMATECDWVTGCYFLVRREVTEQVGLFDPRYFMYCEEMDLCRAAKRAGWKVVFYPETSVVHLGGESAKSDGTLTRQGKQLSPMQIESELLFFRKQYGLRGALASLFLSTVQDVWIAVKHLVRGRAVRHLKEVFKHLLTVWAVAGRTGLGKRPTR